MDSTIFEMTDSLYRNNQGEKAIDFVEKLLPEWKTEGQWSLYVNGLNRLVRYQESNPDISSRIRQNKTAIKSANQYLGKKHWLLGEAYQQEGELLLAQGKLDSALISLGQADQIFYQVQDWESYCWVLVVKSAIFYNQEAFVQGEAAMLKVLEVCKENPELDPEIMNTAIQNLAVIYGAMNAYDKSLELSQKAVRLSLQLPSPSYSDSTDLAARYNNLGVILSERDDYAEAIKNYKISLDLSLKLGRSDIDIINQYHNIGKDLQYLGKLEQAEIYFAKSYDRVKAESSTATYKEVIKTLTFLGAVYLEQNKLAESLTTLEEAHSLAVKNQYYLYWIYYNLGKTYSRNQKWAQSIIAFKKAEELFLQKYGPAHRNTISTQSQLSRTYAETDSLDLAIAYVQKALRGLRVDFEPSSHFDNPDLNNFSAFALLLPILEVKGSVLRRMYQEDPKALSRVLSTYDLADQTITYIRQSQTSQSSKLISSTGARKIYDGAIEILYNLFTESKDPKYLNQAFTYLEKSRSLVLLENLRKYQNIQLNLQPQLSGDSIFQGLLIKEKRLKRDQVFYEKKLSEAQIANDSAQVESLEKSLAGFYQQQQELQRKLQRDYPTYHEANYDTEVAGIEDVQTQLLNPDQALIEYFLGEKHIYVIQITKRKTEFRQLPYPDNLDDLIHDYRQTMIGEIGISFPKTHYQTYTKSAYRLYQTLLKPVVEELSSDVKHLYIIPDGKLGYISFESLLTKMPTDERIDYSTYHLDYVLEKWMVSYGYSSTLLVDELTDVNQPSNLKSYAGFAPVFDQNPTSSERGCLNPDELDYLPNTEISIKKVHHLLGGKAFLREMANKDNFISHAADYRILHLSTHACVDQEDPLFNRIFFARDYLSAYEIYNLELNAELVVLSACETGFGEIAKGEGVMSLARSFVYAGSKSIVTSLWNADDQATTELMLIFHQYLDDGIPKAEALHQAKLDYLANNPPRLVPPYYWSNFILIGNADSIIMNRFPWTYLLLGGLIFLALIVVYLGRKRKFGK